MNLRNHLDPHRFPSRRLDLRVKFWVPPHLLINEPTRHQFYLHAKLDLIEGRLVVADQEVARRIIAYIAQAETGDCDPDVPSLVYAECHKIGPQVSLNLIYISFSLCSLYFVLLDIFITSVF